MAGIHPKPIPAVSPRLPNNNNNIINSNQVVSKPAKVGARGSPTNQAAAQQTPIMERLAKER